MKFDWITDDNLFFVCQIKTYKKEQIWHLSDRVISSKIPTEYANKAIIRWQKESRLNDIERHINETEI